MFYPLGPGGSSDSTILEAKKAAQRAEAAAKACEGIASGQNTIIDDTTAKSYKLGIDNGNIYRKEL